MSLTLLTNFLLTLPMTVSERLETTSLLKNKDQSVKSEISECNSKEYLVGQLQSLLNKSTRTMLPLSDNGTLRSLTYQLEWTMTMKLNLHALASALGVHAFGLLKDASKASSKKLLNTLRLQLLPSKKCSLQQMLPTTAQLMCSE